MQVLMMLVADYASQEPQTGKLNILGVFRNIQSQNFPCMHYRMYLVINIGGEITDKPNPHSLYVSLTDEDGIEILHVSGDFHMPKGNLGIQPEQGLIFELNTVPFSKPGDYRFYLRVDDVELGSTLVQVIQLPTQS